MDNAYYCMRFYVTYRCNSRCHYCNVWQEQRLKGKKEMELKEAESLILQCFKAGVRYIDFTGGEPLLYPHLVDVVNYAKSLGIKTEVTTNGLADPYGVLFDIARCVDKWNLSLDTLEKDSYAAIRGNDGLEQVLRTLEQLRTIRTPRIMMAVSEENQKEMDALIAFARQMETEIYLNPVFDYFDFDKKQNRSDLLHQIRDKTFEPYTVVMLHFMEFISQTGSGNRPPCSANCRTLTFAPDGSLVLPCYHAFQEEVPWEGALEPMLESELFHKYSKKESPSTQCEMCGVIPYFGISFNYQLDSYFLIQSYSEKLNHLKRDYLNRMPINNNSRLLKSLEELLSMIRTLPSGNVQNQSLYAVKWNGRGYDTEVYKKSLTVKQYEKEQKAKDCWQLEFAPHALFDEINVIYSKIFEVYQVDPEKSTLAIFQDAAEFQLRWWKYYISKYMNVSVPCAEKIEAKWILDYLHKIAAWGSQHGRNEITERIKAIERQEFHL